LEKEMGTGKRVKEVRILLKLKQKEMASQMKISSAYLCGVESGIKQANASVIFTLLNKYNVNSQWLAGGTGEIFSEKNNCVYIKSIYVAENSQEYNYPMPKYLIEEKLKTQSDKLIIYEARTNNMSPTIDKGDIVLIDMSDDNTEKEGMYLFKREDKKFIKRLVLIPEKHLVNDNQNLVYGSILLDSSISCIGRVVWFSRKI